MGLVPGTRLVYGFESTAIPVDEAVAVARQVAEALEEAHDGRIVHRDLKPANVKVTEADTLAGRRALRGPWAGIRCPYFGGTAAAACVISEA